jgi:hypothetical protein
MHSKIETHLHVANVKVLQKANVEVDVKAHIMESQTTDMSALKVIHVQICIYV